MDRKPYTIESVRDACEIRTMLAYPYGTRAWLPNQYVLDDIKDAYPGVWQEWLINSAASAEKRGLLGSLRERISKKISDIAAFNLFLQLARRELSEQDAIVRLRALKQLP